jgi:hypothetical protein
MRHKPHETERGHAFAATGFPDDPESFAFTYVERDVIDSENDTRAGEKLGLEVADLKDVSSLRFDPRRRVARHRCHA